MERVKNKYLSWVLVLVYIVAVLTFQVVSVSAEERLVSNPAEFSAAWNNAQTTKIILKNNISYGGGTSGLNNRTTDIEITGEEGQGAYGYKLNLMSRSLQVANPTTLSGKATFKLHDIIVENNGSVTGTRGGFFEDNAYAGTSARNWTFEVGNLQVPTGRTMRLGRVTRGQVDLYGKLDISTLGENFYTGGMYFAEGTEYYGEITQQNYSTIWFRSSIQNGDSGSGKFELAANSSVKLRNTGTGVTYPAIYRAFKEIIIGENSEFTATVPGSAIQFGGTNKKFTAKKGSVTTLTSLNAQSSIVARSTTGGDSGISSEDNPANPINAQMVFEPGSSLYVIGRSGTSGMIDWTAGSNNRLLIDTPKQFDIRNNNTNRALNVGGTNSFQIRDSNLEMWRNTSSVTSSSDFAHNNVKTFSVNGQNVASSSEQQLQTEYNTNNGQIRRIMGLNDNPTVLWQRQLTDADKQMNKIARVRIGIVPDDSGLDADGNLSFIPLYASKNQAKMKISDSKNTYPEKELSTEDEGYISYAIPQFYSANTVLKGKAFRTGLESDLSESKPIVDITPPNPAKLTIGTVKTSTKYLVGKDSEPFSSVYLDINGIRQDGALKADKDGTWKYALKNYLNPNDDVAIYLEDNAGKAPSDLLPVPPVTNNNLGNINPDKKLVYRDATFEPATHYKVLDDVASKPLITKTVKSNTLDANQKEYTKVGSILTYKIVIKNDEKKDSEKILTNSHFEDMIPKGLEFKLSDVEATKNKVKIPTADFRYNDSKLSLSIGKLEPQDEIVINFPTKVLINAVDAEISNTAKISGTTSQEKVLTNESTVKNPGGLVAGELVLESAPATIDFGSITFNSTVQTISNPTYDNDLVISDTRGNKGEGWTLYAKVGTEMTHDIESSSVIVDGFHYISKGTDIPLNNGNQKIYSSKLSEGKDISKTWGDGPKDDGLKLVIDPTTSKIMKGSYTGKIVWQLMEGTP